MKKANQETRDQSQEKVMRVYSSWIVQASAEDIAKMLGRCLSGEAQDADENSSQYFGLSEDGEFGDCEGSHFLDEEVSVSLHPLGERRWILAMAGRADGLKRPGITPPLVDDEGIGFIDKDGKIVLHSDTADHPFGSIKGTAYEALAKAVTEARKQVGK